MFLVEDQLAQRRGALTAVLDRPRDAGEYGLGHPLLPVPLRGQVFNVDVIADVLQLR